MSKQPRDVTGGEAVWGAMFPSLGFFGYVQGIANMIVEVFLRRNFGERYFTQANFIGGLILLLLIQLVTYVIGLFNPFGALAMIFGRSGASVESWMGTITKWYIVLSLLHFLRIWWNNVTGTPVHTFSAGRSWLRPIGRVMMSLLNLFLNNIVRLIFALNRKLDKRRLEFALPVLSDVDTFTERWIEPAFLVFLALFAAGAGQTTVCFWLLFSAGALNVYTGIRHEQERGYWLNIQDSMIEAEYYNRAKNPGKYEKKAMQRQKAYERMMKKAAYEVEKNPDMAKVIERNNPTLADAMRAVHAEPQVSEAVAA